MFFRNIRKLWQPAMYQGKTRMKGYFEGWYYKFADRNGQNIGALIPGVSFDKDGCRPHAFIQFLDNSGVLSRYFRFNIEEYRYSHEKPEIEIGNNFFSPGKIKVDIDDGVDSIKGVLTFHDLTPWPVTLFSPGAMGWYSFVPFMECYHGVLSFDHLIEGQLEFNGKSIDFSGGRGYIEKDWGRSFPAYHIWVQTNHFNNIGTSLMVSIANIPWMGKSFDGFLIGLWHDGQLFKFTTYTGARITTFEYNQQKLAIQVNSKSHRLEIEVSYKKGAELKTPQTGEMRGRLSESLSSETKVKLFRLIDKGESLIFSDIGRHTGLEIEGKLPDKLNQ
jgi:tocopherol cyclase